MRGPTRQRRLLGLGFILLCGLPVGSLSAGPDRAGREPADPATRPRYHLVDLGAAEEACGIQVTALSARGSVAGAADRLDGTVRLLVWSPAGKRAVSAPGYVLTPCHVGPGGEVAGLAGPVKEPPLTLTPPEWALKRPFLWKGGQPSILSGGPFKGFNLQSLAVNDAGHMAGRFFTDSHQSHAFYYDGTRIVDLSAKLGADVRSTAAALNERDQVVGWVWQPAPPGGKEVNINVRAFFWDGRSFTEIASAPGTYTVPTAVNNGGQVAGNISRGLNIRAFIWDRHTNRTLFADGGAHSSYARAINDAGVVVGTHDERAFRWQWGYGFDLDNLTDALGWELEDATAVNNRGQIIGTGRFGGEIHAFRLDPR